MWFEGMAPIKLGKPPTPRDPRGVARRAEAYLESSGIADTAYFGPECEFFVLDEVSYDQGPNHSHYAVDSAEGHWNSGKPGLGYTVTYAVGNTLLTIWGMVLVMLLT